MPFTLGMDEDLSKLTSELAGWANLSIPLMGWDSLSIGVQVYLLQDSSDIVIADYTFGLLLVS